MLLNGLKNGADPLKNLLQDGKSVEERGKSMHKV